MAIALAVICLTACSDNDNGGRNIGDPRYYPTMATTDVSTLISDSGFMRYHITASQWLMYEEADTPYWNFPEGVYMEQFDDSMIVAATFQADSAVYYSTRKIWRFDGRVNMLNNEGDRFATTQLFWDQNKKQVYSDSFMHIERDNRIIEGYGFESDEQITQYTVLHPQMSLPVERRPKATAEPDSASVSPEDESVGNAPAASGTPEDVAKKNNSDRVAPTARELPERKMSVRPNIINDEQ